MLSSYPNHTLLLEQLLQEIQKQKTDHGEAANIIQRIGNNAITLIEEITAEFSYTKLRTAKSKALALLNQSKEKGTLYNKDFFNNKRISRTVEIEDVYNPAFEAIKGFLDSCEKEINKNNNKGKKS